MKKFNSQLLISLVCVMMLSFGIVIMDSIPTSALTYQTTTDVEFTINPSINVSLSSNNLLISDLTPGTSSDSNIITVNVSTNAGYGYYLAATAGTSTGNTNLVNTNDSSRVFTNLSSNKASLSNFSDNTWGYSYSTDNGTSWISGNNDAATAGYNGLPLDNNDNGATGIQLASTDSYVSTNSIKFKIGAKASTTQSGGTYTNTVNFYAVANPEPSLGPVACEAGKICYNVNSLTSTEGTMGKQSAADGNNATLYASNFSRQGYGFAGWSDTYDYSGNLYGPQETITVPNGTSTNGLSLYAIWIRSEGSLQDSSKVASVCNRLTTSGPNVTKTLNSVSALTDQRDNETYAIAKLADGNCWMIENLRLDNTADHNSDGTLSQGYGGVFSGLAEPEAPWADNSTAANSLYYSGTQEGTATIDIGTTNANFRFPRYNNQNTASRETETTDSNTNTYSYGNYYTWHAAIADTTHYSSGNHDGTSICPSGWRIPTGVNLNISNGEYPTLNVLINNDSRTSSDGLRRYPANFIYSGYILSTYAYYRGTSGNYWSSTVWGDNSSSRLTFNVGNVIPANGSSMKYYGLSIRCIVSPST